MKLTTVSATYERKINLGDYNSAHVGMTLWAELDDGDDEAAVANALREMARNHVMTEMARVKPELQAKVQDVFLGLPTTVQKQLAGDIEFEMNGANHAD